MTDRRQALADAIAIVEAETERCWDWIYDLMPCPAQTLAIQILSARPQTSMTAEDLWALVAVATEDLSLPHPSEAQ